MEEDKKDYLKNEENNINNKKDMNEISDNNAPTNDISENINDSNQNTKKTDNSRNNSNIDLLSSCQLINDELVNYDMSFKLILIGDSFVGKSCISTNASKNIFENYYTATVGFEFFSLQYKINSQNIRLQIWDTCGQEQYRSLIQNFYRNSSLAILVYSIDSKQSFENLEIWLNEIRVKGNPDVKIFLVGNKIDLEDKRMISTEADREVPQGPCRAADPDHVHHHVPGHDHRLLHRGGAFRRRAGRTCAAPYRHPEGQHRRHRRNGRHHGYGRPAHQHPRDADRRRRGYAVHRL